MSPQCLSTTRVQAIHIYAVRQVSSLHVTSIPPRHIISTTHDHSRHVVSVPSPTHRFDKPVRVSPVLFVAILFRRVISIPPPPISTLPTGQVPSLQHRFVPDKSGLCRSLRCMSPPRLFGPFRVSSRLLRLRYAGPCTPRRIGPVPTYHLDLTSLFDSRLCASDTSSRLA
jgi:hypothetical protein